jgi:hypothetical protein
MLNRTIVPLANSISVSIFYYLIKVDLKSYSMPF